MPYEFLAKNGLISQGNITATGSLAVTQNISASATGSFGIVGIGTTNPATKFVVATSGTGQLRIGDLGFTSNYAGISLNAGSSYNLLSSPTDSTLYINRPSGGNINFRENNSDQIVLLSGGNVGIGSSSPSSKLEVLTSAVGLANQPNIIGNFRGDTDGRSLIRVDNTSTSAGAAALQSGVSFVAYSNTSNQPSANKHEAQIILGSTGATSVSGGQTGTLQIVAPLDIAFNVSASNTIMTGSSYTTFGSNAMYLARSGKVGIGTTTPVAIVDIQGTNITTYGGSNTGSLGTIYLSGNDAYNSGTAGSGIYFRGKFDAAGTTRTTFGAISAIKENNTDGAFDGALTFFARSGSNAGIIPERMRISSVGNVGIGTTSPIGKLQVGSATFNGGNGVYANDRIGVMLNGSLTSYVYASTYNDPTYPDYGFVFIHGTDTSNYNVWSISPDGPAKGSGLHFIYGVNATNIHSTTPRISFIGSTGNVGIGTTSPDAILTIKSSSPGPYGIGTPDFAIAGNAGGNLTSLQIYRGANTGSYIGIDAFRSGISGTHLVLNAANNGNVGIGTTSPAYTLDVSGSSRHGYRAADNHYFTGSVNISGSLNATASWATNALTASSLVAANSYTITNLTASNIRASATGSFGIVGIGTTIPGAPLDILANDLADGILIRGNDNGNCKIRIVNSGVGGEQFSLTVGYPGASNSSFVIRSVTSSSNRYIIDSSGAHFWSTNAGTALTLNTSGNLGIGTTSPNSKLEVAGTAGTGVVSILNTTNGRSGSFGIDGSGVFIRNSSDGDYFDLKNASGVARFRVIYDTATHLTTNFVSIGNLSATGSKLSVFGNLSVGSSYGSTAAPSNGAIFEGNVGVGTTSTTAKLHVYASGSSVNLLKGVTFNNSNASFNNASLEYYDTSTTDASTVTKVNYNAYFNKRGTANITGYTVGNFFGFTQIDSGSVNAVWDYASRIEVRNQATASSMYHFIADAGYVVAQGGVLGKATDRIGLYVRSQNQSSQTLTSQYGVYIEDLTSSINNYGIYSNISSAGNKYNIYAVGSADNYFAGNVGIGTTTTTSGLLSLHGTYPQLNINNPTTGSGVVIQLRDNGRAAGFMGHSTTTARLQFGSGDSTVTHMTIGESGDVGIGITSPTIQSNYRFLQVNGTNSAVIETMVGGTRIGGFDSTSNTLYVGSIGSFPVVFRTAVDEKMRIAAGGNVGIGTSSPIYKLDVNGDIRAMSGSTIRLQTSAGQERGTFQATDTTGAGGAGLAIATSGGEEIAFKDSADVNMVIKGTGRVGIGTITPAEMLHISSSNNTQLRLESGADAAVQFVGPDTHSYAIGMDDSDDKFKISYNASRTPPGLGTNDRLVITTAGNIGIGATSPSALLHVSDSTSEQVRVQSTGTPTRMRFVNNAGTTYNSYIGADTLGVANVGLIFQTGTSGATRMVIDVNGKVGIGTTIPTSSLDIIGDIKASSSTINILGNLDSLRGNVSTYGYNLTGSPSGTGWISVQTFHNALSSGDILSQLAYDNYNQQKLFTRYSADYGATWSSWKTIINSDALSGTINYIPKFTGTNSIGNSAIYDSGGNVGIATTAPGAPLDVVGQTGTAILRTTTAISTSYAGLRVYNNLNVGTRALEIDYAGSSYAGSLVTSGPTGESACVTTTGAYPLVLGTSNTARMTILGNGNVGIGSASPAYKLDVAGGDVNFSSSTVLRFGTVAVLNTASSPNDIYANIRVLRNESTVNTDGMFINYNSNGTTAAHLRFYANGATERMRIDASNGNVGIGITNPAAKLSVTGSGTGQMLAGDAGFSGGNYTGISVNGTLNTTAYNILSSPTDTNLYINRPSGNTIYFRESNNDQMVLLTGGNLGIGTSNPSAKVQISGSANSVLLNVKSPISGNIVYITGSGAVGINTTTPAYTLQVNGSFAATTKSFVIDHPTKPDKKLVYGSLESPYHGIRLTGRDTLVNGKCVVDLPDYISKLIMPETVNIQLTGIKCNKTLYVDDINIKENNFTVAYDKGVFESYKDYDFFWDFTAVRADVPELQTEM